MKEHIRHRILLICIVMAIAGGISELLYNASYNPDFSVLDAISSATKKSHSKKNKTKKEDSVWHYTIADIALENESQYLETDIVTDTGTYKVLQRNVLPEKVTVLSNKKDADYEAAASAVATYFEKQGYTVSVKSCTIEMMLSLAHAERFDIFVMSEEEAP